MLKEIATTVRAMATRTISVNCEGIDLKTRACYPKILNWLLAEASARFRPLHPYGYPTHLQVEPTNSCNLQCPLCPTAHGLKREQGFMPMGLYKKALTEIGEYLLQILLWDWGEPFLHPELPEMISMAHERSIRVVTSTNGIPLADDDLALRTVKSGLDVLVFAIDGITQETYGAYRKGGELAKALQGVRNVVALKERLRSSRPKVLLRFIVMRQNERELDLLPGFARDLGVDGLSLRSMISYEEGAWRVEGSDTKSFLPEQAKLRRFRTDGNDNRIRYRRNPCKNLWNCPSLHWNGNVSPCTFDPHDQFVLGSLVREPFRDIWVGENYRNFRKEFLNGRSVLCRSCAKTFASVDCGIQDTLELIRFDRPNL
jgi:radical SAM protein with 4Fe4S-binding SPASM domain